MFENLFKNRARKRRQLCSQVADLLVSRLERERALVFDEDLIDQFKIGKHALLRIAYDLAIRERMHIMADDEGRVSLLANAEFRRSMLRRSGAGEEEALLLDEATAPVAEAAMDIKEARVAESPVGTVSKPADEFSWFTLNVAPPQAKGTKGGKMPPKRQTLPARTRDPWVALEGAGLD